MSFDGLKIVARGVKLYRDSNTGRLFAMKKRARRRFAGEFGEDYEGVDLGADGDFGEDYEGEEYEGEIGEDYEGEIGAFWQSPERRLANKQRRWQRGDGRRARRRDRVSDRLADRADGPGPTPQGDEDVQFTKPAVVSGSTTTAQAGAATINIRLQHDFKAEDITFNGSTAGTVVNSIFFGDRHVWSSSTGVPVSVFDVGSFIRGFLEGQYCQGGLDIVVNGTLTGQGTFVATLMGKKND